MGGKLLFYAFVIFFGIALAVIWIDRAMGLEHERAINYFMA